MFRLYVEKRMSVKCIDTSVNTQRVLSVVLVFLIFFVMLHGPVTSDDDDSSESYQLSYTIPENFGMPHLDISSIQIHWIPSPDRQHMDANVTLKLNVPLDEGHAVIFRLVATPPCGEGEIGLWQSCDVRPDTSTLLAIDITTTTAFATFHDVLFGTKYILRVGMQFSPHKNFWQFCDEEISPSCNRSIFGVERCRQPCESEAKPVYNVTVDSVIGTEDNSSCTVTISWSCPVEHRDSVKEYYVVFNNLDAISSIYYSVQRHEFPTYPWDFFRLQTSQSGLILYDEYEILIVPVLRDYYNQSKLGPYHRQMLTLEPFITTTMGVEKNDTMDIFDDAYLENLKAEHSWKYSAIVGGSVWIGATLTLVISILLMRRARKRRQRLPSVYAVCQDDDFPKEKLGWKLQAMSQSLVANQEIQRSNLHIQNEIGRGNFGIVYKATADDTVEDQMPITVAVKMLKDNATAFEKDEFLREITTLQEIGKHANILGILGCCTLEEPYFLITEYMKYGDLLHFLRRTKERRYQNDDPIYNLAEAGYYQIARQIARGMEFLAQNKYVHGDLAARNILVGEDLLIKISDFGLANDVYLQGWTALPASRMRAAKWVSLETNLKGLCTIQSDVWSFGIVLYEIATHGETPYPGMSAAKVVNAVKEGYRMARPDDCPQSMYQIMTRCWAENPEERPTFTDLIQDFNQLLSQFAEYINEQAFPYSTDDTPLQQIVTHESDVESDSRRETTDDLMKQAKDSKYSTGESAFCESNSMTSFEEYITSNSDVEDFSDSITFEVMSESDNDEGFFP
ncbi:uncharacterized protein [Ptychodera flava]|uniref:uncharacterized protein isoform X2 n=1 Tax=Ptychodera flava TaxID=63121 RepID=UPI003969CFF9